MDQTELTTIPDEDVVFAAFGDLQGNGPQRLLRWWEEMEVLAEVGGTRINAVGASFKTRPRGMASDRAYRSHRYWDRIRKQTEANNVEYLELMALRPNGRNLIRDSVFTAEYGLELPKGREGLFVLGACAEFLKNSGRSAAEFVEAARQLCVGYLAAKYGFAILMPRKFMPVGYAMGVSMDGFPDEMSADASACVRYDDQGKPCGSHAAFDRRLRNVYGLNLLSEQHLNIAVGDQRLEEWIASAEWRGRIEPLDEGCFLWTFREGEDRGDFLRWDYPPVVRVREALKQHKVFWWQHLPW